MTVLDRFTLFTCVSMDYMGVGCPYIPPKRTAQRCHDIFYFLYFLFCKFLFPHYSRIFFFIFSIYIPFTFPTPLCLFSMYLPRFHVFTAVIPLYILYKQLLKYPFSCISLPIIIEYLPNLPILSPNFGLLSLN